MFEIGQGSGSEWQAQTASRLEPNLAFKQGLGFNASRAAPGFFPARDPSRKLPRRVAVPLMLALLLGAFGLWCRLSFTPVSGASSFRSDLDGIARLAGFGIDMVVLSGHRFTADSDIFDALDLPNARSLVSFDTQGVRQRLERLPWVMAAELTRVFPDRLDIRITERKAFAIWERNGQAQLIDRSGRVLSSIGNGKNLDLPRIAGEGAATEAENFLAVIDTAPAIRSRLIYAERVGERRWTLHLEGAITVHLPPDREAAVLSSVSEGGRFESLLAAGNQVVDLRTPGRIAIRADKGSR